MDTGGGRVRHISGSACSARHVAVSFVCNKVLVGTPLRWGIFAVEIRAAEVAIVRERAEHEGEAARHVDVGRITLGIGRGIIRHSPGQLVAQLLAGTAVVVNANDGCRVRVVRDHNDQRIVARGGKILRHLHGIIEQDRVVHRALPIQGVCVLIDAARFHHQHKTLVVLREDVERDAQLVGQIGLVGKSGDGPLLEEEAIERTVDIAGIEQAKEFARTGGSGELRLGRYEGVAGTLELVDVVLAVGSPAARNGRRQEVDRAAAQDHLGLHVEKHFHDVIVIPARAGMRDHAGRRGILDFSRGDDADRHATHALGEFRYGLDLGMVKVVAVAGAVYAQRVVARLVTSRVGMHAVGAVGDDRSGARGRDQRRSGHVVDRKLAAIAAFDEAFRQDARGKAMGERHPIADEQDHVLRFGRRRVENFPGHAGLALAGGGLNRVAARLAQHRIANPVGGEISAVLALDHRRALADDGCGVRAVDRHAHGRGGWSVGEFDLEVELGASQDFGPVQRIDGLGLDRDRCNAKKRRSNADCRWSFHRRLMLVWGWRIF